MCQGHNPVINQQRRNERLYNLCNENAQHQEDKILTMSSYDRNVFKLDDDKLEIMKDQLTWKNGHK